MIIRNPSCTAWAGLMWGFRLRPRLVNPTDYPIEAGQQGAGFRVLGVTSARVIWVLRSSVDVVRDQNPKNWRGTKELTEGFAQTIKLLIGQEKKALPAMGA